MWEMSVMTRGQCDVGFTGKEVEDVRGSTRVGGARNGGKALLRSSPLDRIVAYQPRNVHADPCSRWCRVNCGTNPEPQSKTAEQRSQT